MSSADISTSAKVAHTQTLEHLNHSIIDVDTAWLLYRSNAGITIP